MFTKNNTYRPYKFVLRIGYNKFTRFLLIDNVNLIERITRLRKKMRQLIEEAGSTDLQQEIEKNKQKIRREVSFLGVGSTFEEQEEDHLSNDGSITDKSRQEKSNTAYLDVISGVSLALSREENAEPELNVATLSVPNNKNPNLKFRKILERSHVQDLVKQQRSNNWKNVFIRNQSAKYIVDNDSSYASDLEDYKKIQDKNKKDLEMMVLDPAFIQCRKIKAVVKKLAELEWKFMAFLLDRIAMIILAAFFILALCLLISNRSSDKQVEEFLKQLHILPSDLTDDILKGYHEANAKNNYSDPVKWKQIGNLSTPEYGTL